ncbi:hypothetical protein SNE40_003254 [Patella caerulea]|uniref:Uncharacterized protein n=1 Tax=Patella caerulea TaxID=87958 RepID=A0AAN8KDH8_PATCE
MYSVRQVKLIVMLTENLFTRRVYGSRSSNIFGDNRERITHNIWTKVEDLQLINSTTDEALPEQGKAVEERKCLEVFSSEMRAKTNTCGEINQSSANSSANQYTTHNFKDLSVTNQTMLYTL